MLQLNPPLWVRTTQGDGRALFLIDYGMDHNTCWVVTLNDSGKIDHFDSNEVFVMGNLMYDVADPRVTRGERLVK